MTSFLPYTARKNSRARRTASEKAQGSLKREERERGEQRERKGESRRDVSIPGFCSFGGRA